MKNTCFVICLILAIALVPSFCREPYRQPALKDLNQEYFSKIFEGADTNRDGVLSGEDEIKAAVRAVGREIFIANNYFLDDEMIQAFADDYYTKHSEKMTQRFFESEMAPVPKQITEFRNKIFADLFKIYNVENLMDDADIASEVYNCSDVYGLTYAAYKVLFFNFDQAAKNAGVDPKKFENLEQTTQRTEEIRTEKITIEVDNQVAGGDNTGVVTPGSEKVTKETITETMEIDDVKTTYGTDGKVESREEAHAKASETRSVDL